MKSFFLWIAYSIVTVLYHVSEQLLLIVALIAFIWAFALKSWTSLGVGMFAFAIYCLLHTLNYDLKGRLKQSLDDLKADREKSP